jgi:hypothetical protein
VIEPDEIETEDFWNVRLPKPGFGDRLQVRSVIRNPRVIVRVADEVIRQLLRDGIAAPVLDKSVSKFNRAMLEALKKAYPTFDQPSVSAWRELPEMVMVRVFCLQGTMTFSEIRAIEKRVQAEVCDFLQNSVSSYGVLSKRFIKENTPDDASDELRERRIVWLLRKLDTNQAFIGVGRDAFGDILQTGMSFKIFAKAYWDGNYDLAMHRALGMNGWTIPIPKSALADTVGYRAIAFARRTDNGPKVVLI